MANHGQSFGLSEDVANTLKAKYDPKMESEVREWLRKVTGEPVTEDFHELMKSGVFLCNFINKIRPGSVNKINKQKMPFTMMENIGNYLDACTKVGLPKTDLFQTVDLYEAKNMTAVLIHLYALGRFVAKVPGWSGPVILPDKVNVDPEKVFGLPQ
eukprot:TRINITY_DN14026_c0_g1_i1.p1 TRINITY_DN14026_c0_g1~~TRINITY_DN14026_c0_g1_i1.p1  ORF type:complete len:156 (+),score=32.92 TRINITY_DN14026_c0_g1_i1:18-485(+)